MVRRSRRGVVPVEKADPETKKSAAWTSPRIGKREARAIARGAGGDQDENTETEGAEAFGELRTHQRADRRERRLDRHHSRSAVFFLLIF